MQRFSLIFAVLLLAGCMAGPAELADAEAEAATYNAVAPYMAEAIDRDEDLLPGQAELKRAVLDSWRDRLAAKLEAYGLGGLSNGD